MGLYGKGERIEVHPATDWWMRGARYGNIRGVIETNGATLYRVKLDHVLRIIHLAEQDILRSVD